MNKKIIKVPRLDQNIDSFDQWDRFISIVSPLFDKSIPIILDFSECGFIGPEGTALIAGLKIFRNDRGYITELDVTSVLSSVKVVLERSGLMGLFFPSESGWQPSHKDSTLPIFCLKSKDKDSAIEYIENQILIRKEVPHMTERLKKDIRVSFFEIFNNIFNHSESPIGGVVCGQVFPTDHTVKIVFYDTGIGVANKVLNHKTDLKSDVEAIEWALERGNSTLGETIGQPRGLGLYLIQEFIKINTGIFRISANSGALMEKDGKRSKGMLSLPLHGTIIDITIKTQEHLIYGYKDEFSYLRQ